MTIKEQVTDRTAKTKNSTGKKQVEKTASDLNHQLVLIT